MEKPENCFVPGEYSLVLADLDFEAVKKSITIANIINHYISNVMVNNILQIFLLATDHFRFTFFNGISPKIFQ